GWTDDYWRNLFPVDWRRIQGKGSHFLRPGQEKHPPVGTPETFRRINIKEKSKNELFLVIDNEAALLSVAQIAGLEVHVWGSQADTLEQPDRLIFDLDPDTVVPWQRGSRKRSAGPRFP